MPGLCLWAHQLMLREEAPVFGPALVGGAVQGAEVGHLGERDAEEEQAGQAQEPRVALRASVQSRMEGHGLI